MQITLATKKQALVDSLQYLQIDIDVAREYALTVKHLDAYAHSNVYSELEDMYQRVEKLKQYFL